MIHHRNHCTARKRIRDKFMPIALIAKRDEDITLCNAAAVNRNASHGNIRRKRAIGDSA
jgi:hypothetical protein